jgi:hypothetical protein
MAFKILAVRLRGAVALASRLFPASIQSAVLLKPPARLARLCFERALRVYRSGQLAFALLFAFRLLAQRMSAPARVAQRLQLLQDLFHLFFKGGQRVRDGSDAGAFVPFALAFMLYLFQALLEGFQFRIAQGGFAFDNQGAVNA